MNPKIERLRAEREKTANRLCRLQKNLKQLDEQISQLENTDIIGIVRASTLTLEEFAELMRGYRQKEGNAASEGVFDRNGKEEPSDEP